jgi:Cytochrome c7 and related cytochrome c/Class III cytochrome C family
MALVIVVLVTGMFLLQASGKPEAPRQPIDFNHWQHVTKKGGPELDCAYCHEHADKSPHATIPNTETCMACHLAEKTDSPEVQKLAATHGRGEQPRWARVYWFEKEAHVFFTHKPHARAGVDCAECHGKVGESHQLRREIKQSMGWCMDCHRARRESVDCYVCHR